MESGPTKSFRCWSPAFLASGSAACKLQLSYVAQANMVSVATDKRKAFQFPNSLTLSAFLFNLLLDQVSEFQASQN